MTWADVAKQAFDGLQAVAIAVGGAWAFWLFILQRRFAPQIEFEVDATVMPYSEAANLVEFVLTVRNKGLVRHKIWKLRLSVQALEENIALDTWKGHGERLYFPTKLLTDERIFPEEKWKYSFVEPGVCQRYTYVAHVKSNYRYLLINGQFLYNDDPLWPHSASKLADTHARLSS